MSLPLSFTIFLFFLSPKINFRYTIIVHSGKAFYSKLIIRCPNMIDFFFYIKCLVGIYVFKVENQKKVFTRIDMTALYCRQPKSI